MIKKAPFPVDEVAKNEIYETLTRNLPWEGGPPTAEQSLLRAIDEIVVLQFEKAQAHDDLGFLVVLMSRYINGADL